MWYEPVYIRSIDTTVVFECYQRAGLLVRDPVGCYKGEPADKWTECFKEVQA